MFVPSTSFHLKFAAALVLATYCAAPLALASEKKALHGGEFRNTAQTTEKGEFVYHPLFLKSHMGISNRIDAKFPTLGLIAGPDLSIEVGIVDNDSLAFSVEPYGRSNWGFNTAGGGANLRFTKHLGSHRFNLSTGFGLGTQPSLPEEDAPLMTYSVPVNTGFDISLKDTQALRITASTDVSVIDAGLTGAIVGVNYNTRVSKTFGLAAGVATYVGGNPITKSGLDEILGINSPKVIPLPTFEMWAKI
jgi:hypothetical protein